MAGDLYLVYLLLPTSADMRFHCEYKLVKASKNRRSLIGSMIRYSTKFSLFSSEADTRRFKGKQGEDFRKEQTVEKIRITNMKSIRDDALLFTYWSLVGGVVELEEYKVEDFWKNEMVAKMSIDKISKVKLDLLKHVYDTDCDQKTAVFQPRNFSIHTFKILDTLIYRK